MGSISVRERLLLYPARRVRSLPPGQLGVVFQSGGTFQFWLQQAALRGLGFSYAVSSGNELDLDIADYINFLVDDDATRQIACMVEGIRRPRAFMRAAERALEAGKPILMVKLGRSERGKAAASSHTGAIAGDDRVFDAVCRKYGIVRCTSLDDLMESALAFAAGRLPRGPRIALAGYSGGAKGLLLDEAAALGAELAEFTPETTSQLQALIDPGLPPENPLDTGANVGIQPERFAEICQIVCADPNVDLISVHGILPVAETDPFEPGPLASVRASTDKPLLAFGRIHQNVSEVSRRFEAETGVPFIQGLPETMRALQGLVTYAATARRGITKVPPASVTSPPEPEEFEQILARGGMAPPKSARARTPAEAKRAAETLGFPIAAKIISPEASHKTEVGGVQLHLADPAAVETACAKMIAKLHQLHPDAEIDGFLLQEMVDGVELILGVREDPHYGPIMVVGLGGILVEALDDVALRLLPVNATTAHEMLRSLRGFVLLNGFRNRARCDIDAVVGAMVALSDIFLKHRSWLADLEINPLIVLPEGDGVRAVDIRLVTATG